MSSNIDWLDIMSILPERRTDSDTLHDPVSPLGKDALQMQKIALRLAERFPLIFRIVPVGFFPRSGSVTDQTENDHSKGDK